MADERYVIDVLVEESGQASGALVGYERWQGGIMRHTNIYTQTNVSIFNIHTHKPHSQIHTHEHCKQSILVT